MLIHSYKVEVNKLKLIKKQLEYDLLINPNNTRAKSTLEDINKELDWFESKIKEGKDPGVRIQ